MWSSSTIQLVLPGMIIVIGLAVGLYFLLKNKSPKAKLIPFMVISVICVLLEIAKQVLGLVAATSYNLFWLPVHVCSFFVFLAPFAVFLKQDSKVSNILWSMTLVVGTLITLFMVFAPEMLMGAQTDGIVAGVGTSNSGDVLFLDWHSYLYHLLVVLFTLLAFMFKSDKFALTNILWGTLGFIGMLVVAVTMASVLKVNFASFYDGNFGTSGSVGLRILMFIIFVIAYLFVAFAIYFIQKLYKKKKSPKTLETK